MRSMFWSFAALVIGSLVLVAWDASSVLGCHRCGASAAYAAPACGAPGYGWAPGCCECAPSCCDHVWDGYCQQKAARRCCARKASCAAPCLECQPGVDPMTPPPGSVLDMLPAPQPAAPALDAVPEVPEPPQPPAPSATP